MIFFLLTDMERNILMEEALTELLNYIPKKLELKRREFPIILSVICSLQIRLLSVVYKQLVNL